MRVPAQGRQAGGANKAVAVYDGDPIPACGSHRKFARGTGACSGAVKYNHTPVLGGMRKDTSPRIVRGAIVHQQNLKVGERLANRVERDIDIPANVAAGYYHAHPGM
jgi:hypothetical protein